VDIYSIEDMANGWFIGNFEPATLKTANFEVAHHSYKKGFKGTPHIHRVATEYNYILKGKLRASGVDLETGDIFVYNPDEVSDVEFFEDTELVIVKTPSVPGDKYDI
jgi:quercetin dioxygenase-like cupin family protein